MQGANPCPPYIKHLTKGALLIQKFANHSERRLFMKDLFKMNLQLFAEEDDVILPDEDIILPDDDTTDEEPAEPQAGEEPAEDTTPEADTKPEPYKLKIKYNHEEMEIPEDEAVPLIQKGMNYDKLQERYNQIQNDPRLSKYEKVQQVSKLLGYQSDDQLLDALYQTYYQTTAQEQGLTPEQVRKEHELQQKEAQLSAKEKAELQERQKTEMYDRFLTAYPNVKPQDIKPETWEKVKAGIDLTVAYTQQVNEELQAQIKMLKQKEKNKNQAPVGGVTQHGSTDTQKIDPFLEGFDSIE
jgi:hypothetical protein